MDRLMRQSLDRWITGNYGEDQFLGYFDCPACDKTDLAYDDQLYVEEARDEGEERCPHCKKDFEEVEK